MEQVSGWVREYGSAAGAAAPSGTSGVTGPKPMAKTCRSPPVAVGSVTPATVLPLVSAPSVANTYVVTVWEPPHRLVYLWHLRQDRADATEVEIRFLPHGEAATHVEIEHRGWEALGAQGEDRRDRNHGGWATLLPHYVAAVAASANDAMSG